MLRLALMLTALLMSGTALVAQNASPKGSHGAHFIDNWDADGDGAVTLAEATAKREAVFAAFDADEDGRLSAEEYELFDEARANDQAEMQTARAARAGKAMGQGMKGQGMDEEGGMTLGFNDVDADGSVSFDEFMTRTPDWIAQMDRNADGQITVEDFGRK